MTARLLNSLLSICLDTQLKDLMPSVFSPFLNLKIANFELKKCEPKAQ